MFQLKKRRKIRGKLLGVFGKNFPEFTENFLPKFLEIFLILFFLKDKISAVTCVSSPENAGKSGGKFPEISREKTSRRFSGISGNSGISRNLRDTPRGSYEHAPFT